MRPMRSEVSGNVDYGDNVELLSVTYSPEGVETGPGLLNREDWVFNTPVLVHWYEAQVTTNFIGVVFQCYGDSDDAGNLGTYDTANEEFYSGLKKYRMVGPHHPVRFTYSSKWNRKHKKWDRPPIKLGTPNAGGNYFNIGLVNQEYGTTSKEYFAISRWRFHKLD